MVRPCADAAVTPEDAFRSLPAPVVFVAVVSAVGGAVVVVDDEVVVDVEVDVDGAPVAVAGGWPCPRSPALPGRSSRGAAPEGAPPDKPTIIATATAASARIADSLSVFGRRNAQPADDDAGVSEPELLAVYDKALPEVFGYLVRRCPSPAVAEDLTAETFLAAVAAVRRGTVESLTPAWLIAVARNKLVDHWRRMAREPETADDDPVVADDWTDPLEPGPALDALRRLGPHHRVALTLRYLDGLSVPEVADHLGRTVHATEALLVRARAAFRKAYTERRGDA